MRNFKLIILMSIITVSLLFEATAAKAQLIFSGTFDSGNILTEDWVIEAVKCGSIPCAQYIDVINTGPGPRAGGHFGKFTINRSQPLIAGGQRTEVKTNFVKKDIEYWYGWSVYFPNDFVFDTQCPAIITQWHNYRKLTPGSGAPFRITVRNDEMWFVLKQQDSPSVWTRVYTDKIVKGEWIDWVLRIVWNDNGKGLLDLYRNGVLIASLENINTTYVDRAANWKFGPYRRDWDTKTCDNNDPITIYYDEGRVAQGPNNYSLVAPPGSPPLMDLDSDGDSIPDTQDAFPNDPTEWQDTDGDDIGNNADPDDDNDGLPDGWEIQYGLDPLNASDAASDLDGDTLSNLEEFKLNTHPALTDTDADGVDDNVDLYPTDSARSRENNSPVAMNDNASTGEGMAITIDLVSNDTDSDGDMLTIASVDNASANSGVIVNNGNGTITYTPASDFSGNDNFNYTVSDGNGGFDTATVNVTVTLAVTPGEPDNNADGNGSDESGDNGSGGGGSFDLYALLILLLGGMLRWAIQWRSYVSRLPFLTISPRLAARKKRTIFIYAILTTFGFFITTPAYSELLLNSDFETGEYSSYGWNTSGNSTASVVDAPTDASTTECSRGLAARFYLDWDQPVTYRTQLTLNTRPMREFFIGNEYWIGFSVYLPADWKPDQPKADDIIFGMHGRPDRDIGEGYRKGMFNIRIIEDNWIFLYSKDAKRNTGPQGEGKVEQRRQIKIGKVEPGKWVNFVFHAKLTYKPNGFVYVWKDGVKVATKTEGIGYNDAKGPYAKIGIYKSVWGKGSRKDPTKVDSREVYIDNFRVGDGNSSYADVVSKCKTPTNANQNPIAINDNATTEQDIEVTIDVLANDSDQDSGDNLNVSAVTQGDDGTVTRYDTNVVYTPNIGFSGSDSFTYSVTDGLGGFDTATVNVTINSSTVTIWNAFDIESFSNAIDSAVENDVIAIQNDIDLAGLTKTISTPNLTIQGQGAVQYVLSNPGKLTVTDAADNLTIRNLEFRDSQAVFELSATNDSTLSGLTVDNTIFRGVVDAIKASRLGSFGFTARLDNVTITNSQFLDVTTQSGSVEQVMLRVVNLANVTINNNVFRNLTSIAENKVSIAVQIGDDVRTLTPKNAWITNNYFEKISGFNRVNPGTEVHAVMAFGRDIHIIGNTVIDISPGEDHEAFKLEVDNSEILNNYIQNGGGKGGDGAIALKDNHGGNQFYLNFNNVIRGNVLIQTAAYADDPDYVSGSGIRVVGGATIEHNLIINRSQNTLGANKAGIVVHGVVGPDNFGQENTGASKTVIRNNQIYTSGMIDISQMGTVKATKSEIFDNQVILRDSSYPFISTKNANVPVFSNSTCLESTCPMPTYLVSGTVQSDTSALVTWTDNSAAGANSVNETGFRVQYRVDDGQTWYDAAWSNFETTATADTPRLVVTGLAAGTKYRFRVQAFSGTNDSIWSPESDAVTTTRASGGNNAPTAYPDSANIVQDLAVVIDVLVNDVDPNITDTLSISAVTQGNNGSVTNNSTNVTYIPDIGFIGSDNFTYTVSDGNGGFDTATVNVTVTSTVTLGEPDNNSDGNRGDEKGNNGSGGGGSFDLYALLILLLGGVLRWIVQWRSRSISRLASLAISSRLSVVN